MTTKEIQIRIERIRKFHKRLAKMWIRKQIPLQAEMSWSADPVPFDLRSAGSYSPVREGDPWGKAWESAWFHVTGSVPDSWQGLPVAAQLDFSGEGLVFDRNGVALQGITNGSIFNPDFARTVVPLIQHAQGSEEIDLWVEAAANSLFGVYLDGDPAADVPHRYGHFDAKVECLRLVALDEGLWHLWLDMQVMVGMIHRLPVDSVRRARVIHCADDAIDAFAGLPENGMIAREILSRELSKPASPSDLRVTAVGHAHIDTAWLWPVRETIRKCARTFSTQLSIIDAYPEYVFGASQPQHYAFIKEHYPEIYTRIQKAVSNERWEVQGAMWVEADCNLISGESMIRQILHGKNFFRDEFGIDVKNLWLPDVFGYSAALPQILRRSGVEFFLTQKLSWSQVNEFPHHTFRWRGLDGSEVLTHFPPENTYNSELDSEFLIPAQTHFKEKDILDEFISLFGVGDGGGGPKPENIELGKRLASLEGCPQVQFGTAADFFQRLALQKDKLPIWTGELYLEMHRGTLTSQARVKKGNRMLEQKLRTVEFLWSHLPMDQYPGDELDKIWKNTLLNQFHDILPGSSIHQVYVDTHQDHEDSLKSCEQLVTAAAEQLFQPDDNALTLVNILHNTVEDAIQLPNHWSGAAYEDGTPLPAQKEDGKMIALARVQAYSFLTIHNAEEWEPGSFDPQGLVLENDHARYEFSSEGTLVSSFLTSTGRSILEPQSPGNCFTLYEDRPNNWDAWDIDSFYENAVIEHGTCLSIIPLPSGPVRQGLQLEIQIGHSRIRQKIFLNSNTARLDFQTEVSWHEKHRMLRVAFPVDIHSPEASYDIQYGYVKRPTHQNTSWDRAKFEVAAHRYADLSDNDHGVALLNDCKYGHRIHNNIIDLNLLRSPNNPDPDADQGEHLFTYCLYPHTGDLIRSGVIPQAAQINQHLIAFPGFASSDTAVPFRLTGNGLSIEAVKKAEKDDDLIIRIVETLGCRSEGALQVSGYATIKLTDLMEWEVLDEYPADHPLQICLSPFEIRTYKLGK